MTSYGVTVGEKWLSRLAVSRFLGSTRTRMIPRVTGAGCPQGELAPGRRCKPHGIRSQGPANCHCVPTTSPLAPSSDATVSAMPNWYHNLVLK